MRKSPPALEASTKVVDGEVIVYWHDAHLNSSNRERARSPLRERVSNLRDVTGFGGVDYSVTRGKFRLHLRKEVCEATTLDEGCYFQGEHLISQEFRSRVCMTRVEL